MKTLKQLEVDLAFWQYQIRNRRAILAREERGLAHAVRKVNEAKRRIYETYYKNEPI